LLLAAALCAALLAGTAAAAAPAEPPALQTVVRKTIEVDGIRIFYREAGNPSQPTILLLHGYPSSSLMYRDPIPLLAPHFHLVAPDYPGFGFSEAPPNARFDATFANLARVTADFTQSIQLKSFIVYMQDFGGPVGFRIAVEHPDWILGLIIQNANAYLEGIVPEQLAAMKERAAPRLGAGQEARVDKLVGPDLTMFMYRAGARDFRTIDPASYSVDNWILAQPANHRIQRALIAGYDDNVVQYPKWQAYLREHRPRTLIVWGRNDPIFLPAGAQAYRRDVPQAELHYFDTGHFALEEDAPAIARDIIASFGR
jgi:pimeloyl-ACP methyl ester carboxylesterase